MACFFRQGSLIASIEVKANASIVETGYLDEIFRDSENFSNPLISMFYLIKIIKLVD